MKKITVDARMIDSSGIGTVIKNILKRLIIFKPDWHFCILGDTDKLKQYTFMLKNNVQLINCKAPIYSLNEQLELNQKIPKDTDIMWSPHYNIPIFYRGELLVTVHDIFHLAMPQFVKGINKKLYARCMFYMVKKKATHIVCVSKFTANELRKYVGINDNDISVIYNGIDEEWFNIAKDKPIYDKPYLLFVGNVKPHKNLINLVKAFKLIKDKIPHDLVIVGKKEGFITADNQIDNLVKDLKDRIVFTGYVEDSILKQYYKQADLFVFPSLYEGFGIPPLEALATSIKVIASDISSVREICDNMVEYFNPEDVSDISSCIINNINIKTYTDRDKLQYYNWNNTVEQYIKLIEKYS